MLTAEKRPDGILHVVADGRLTPADYDSFVPRFARLADRRRPILMELKPGFRGWTIAGLLRDLKFDLEFRNRFGRIAVLGRKRWQRWLTAASSLMFPYEIRFFDAEARAEAEAWLAQFRQPPPAGDETV